MFLLLITVAVLAKEICLPDKHEVYLVDPEKKFDDVQQVYFDLEAKKIRTDMFIMDPIERFLQTYSFFDEKKAYVYDYKLNECWMQPLTEEIKKECISREAVYEGDMKVGSMTVSTWREFVGGEEGLKITLEKKNDWPITVTAYGTDRKQKFMNAIHAEFYNFGTTFNSTEKFTLPAACK